MKKIFFILIFLGFASQAQACLCMSEISDAYDTIVDKVKDVIKDQTSAINDDLIPEIKKNTDNITEQSEVLKKIIKAETRKAVQNTQIVFLLQKIAELKTAGEM